jgi:ankyrin repeat protein
MDVITTEAMVKLFLISSKIYIFYQPDKSCGSGVTLSQNYGFIMNNLLKLIVCFSVLALLTTPVFAHEIHDAVETGDLEKVKTLLVDKAELLDLRLENGLTPLAVAAYSNQPEILEFLIKSGADVNSQNERGSTPLHGAAYYGFLECVKLLLNNNADINTSNNSGYTPLKSAISANQIEVLEFIVKSGAELNSQNRAGNTPLHTAATFSSDEIFETLMLGEVDVNLANRAGCTVLHIKAARGQDDHVQMLLDRGAELQVKTVNGKNALNYAKNWRRDSTVELLKSKGLEDIPEEFPVYSGKYLGMPLPGIEPELFAPDVFIVPFYVHGPLSFTKDAKTLFFSQNAFPIEATWFMKEIDGQWTSPETLLDPLVEEETFPKITPDGKKLFYASRVECENEDGTIGWKATTKYLERAGNEWSDPKVFMMPWCQGKSIYSVAFSNDETMFFFSKDFEGHIGQDDLFYSELIDGEYQEPRSFGENVNTEHYEIEPAVSPDGSYVVFASSRPLEIGGRLNLYVTFKSSEGSWTTPQNLGESINQGSNWRPFLTYDGKFLFFQSDKNGMDQYYWVSAELIEDLRPDEL